jgi:hypothetical protein
MTLMNPWFGGEQPTEFEAVLAADPPTPHDIEEARFLLTSGIVPDSFLTRTAFAMAWAVVRHDFLRRRSPVWTPAPTGDAA